MGLSRGRQRPTLHPRPRHALVLRREGDEISARAKITSGFSESFRRGIVTLPKIRNPKLEVRNKPEGPKSESQNRAAWRRSKPWSLRILDLFRISGFGFVGPQMAAGKNSH